MTSEKEKFVYFNEIKKENNVSLGKTHQILL